MIRMLKAGKVDFARRREFVTGFFFLRRTEKPQLISGIASRAIYKLVTKRVCISLVDRQILYLNPLLAYHIFEIYSYARTFVRLFEWALWIFLDLVFIKAPPATRDTAL